MKDEKNIEKTIDTANGEGANNTNNVEKLNKLFEAAKKAATTAKETGATDADKTNATNAANAVIETLEKVPFKGYIKIQKSWYKLSGETRETWLNFTGTDKTTKEKVTVTPEKVEEQIGKCLYVVRVLFDAKGWAMESGQATKGFFEKINGFKTMSQIKDLFNLEKDPKNTATKDPNQAAIKALSNFAAAIGAKFDESVFEGVDNAAEVILSGAQKFIDGQRSEIKEVARNKKIAAAVATMTANNKVNADKAKEYAAELYKDDCKLNATEIAFVISKVADGKDFKKAVEFATM